MLLRTDNVFFNSRKIEFLIVITWNDEESDDDDSTLSVRHALKLSLTFIFVNNHQTRNDDANQNSKSDERIDTFRSTFTDYCLIAEVIDFLTEEVFFSTAKVIDTLIEEVFFSTAEVIDSLTSEVTDSLSEKAFLSTSEYAANNEIHDQKSDVDAANTRTQTIYSDSSDDAEEDFRRNIEINSFNIDDENVKKDFSTQLEFADYYMKDSRSDDNQSQSTIDSLSISMQDVEKVFINENISMISSNHNLIVDDENQNMNEDEIQFEKVTIESENENLFIVCDFHSKNETNNNAKQRLRYSSRFSLSHFTTLFDESLKRQRQR